MKTFLLMLTFSLALSADVGWNGSTYEVDALGRVSRSVSVTADLQLVGVKKFSLVKLTSDDPVATDRTIRLTIGETKGQSLVLILVSANPLELLDDQSVPTAGSIKLSADWLPGQWDTLSLIWTGSHWLEVSRSDN